MLNAGETGRAAGLTVLTAGETSGTAALTMPNVEVQLDVKMDPAIIDRDQRSPLPDRTLGELLATLIALARVTC